MSVIFFLMLTYCICDSGQQNQLRVVFLTFLYKLKAEYISFPLMYVFYCYYRTIFGQDTIIESRNQKGENFDYVSGVLTTAPTYFIVLQAVTACRRKQSDCRNIINLRSLMSIWQQKSHRIKCHFIQSK